MQLSRMKPGLAVGLLAAVLAVAGCGDRAGGGAAGAAKEVKIVYTGNVGGEIEPCG